jgi:hypothetical protein
MLRIVLTDTNQEIELVNDTVKYTKQCNDIADLSSRETNFTDSFNAPKNSHNTNVFNELGLVADVSTLPYQKVRTMLLDNGVPLLRDGWLNIKETANDYKLHVYDGIIDLFKAIENKTFGDDIDLSEINHDKNINTVIASFTNPNYKYIINDYGGKTHTQLGNKINIDYLVPSVNVKYLWDKIFTTFGFNYIGNIFNTIDFNGLWLTYPKGIDLDVSTSTTLYADLTQWNNDIFQNINLITGNLINDSVYVVATTGSYKITIAGRHSLDVDGEVVQEPLIFSVNGLDTAQTIITSFGTPIFLNLSVGDEIYFKRNEDENLVLTNGFMKIEKYNNAISFSEELKQLSLTDFFKDILWRFGLTVFVDIDNNYIFKTFDERLQAGVVDWSEKYKSRTSETYVINNYAQKNYFRQNYNDKEGTFNDGFFTITNKNLDARKDLIKSKFYSHNKDFVNFYINPTTNLETYETSLWEREVNENNDVQEIKYKSLSERFYLLREETINVNTILRTESSTSGQSSVEQAVTSLPVARFYKTNFKDFVSDYYENISLLLNDFRFHKITLHIDTNDFINLDFDKIYYFEQEQNYYLLNKISFERGKLSNAEFYRIKYAEQ